MKKMTMFVGWSFRFRSERVLRFMVDWGLVVIIIFIVNL